MTAGSANITLTTTDVHSHSFTAAASDSTSAVHYFAVVCSNPIAYEITLLHSHTRSITGEVMFMSAHRFIHSSALSHTSLTALSWTYSRVHKKELGPEFRRVLKFIFLFIYTSFIQLLWHISRLSGIDPWSHKWVWWKTKNRCTINSKQKSFSAGSLVTQSNYCGGED